MKEGLAEVDWEKVRQHEEEMLKGKLHRGPGLKLPDAQSPRTFLVDMTMEYPEDITDPTSKTILVKAGARVNPLQKVTWPYAMIFLNADNQDQVRWAQRYLDAHDRMYVKVAVTEGDIAEAMKALEHRVYWADTYLLQRFGVVAVPSEVKQEGERLKVQEYALR
jgi:conjugal transfer pilus assembly protein TraW